MEEVFESGTFVRLKTDSDRSGIVQPGSRTLAGKLMVQVLLPDGQRRMLPAEALEKVPQTPERLIDRFADGKFVARNWLRRMLTQIRVTGRMDDIVYSMGATKTDFLPYQFKPVLKLLNSPTDGLLLADEVGLGKTIEAGLIWTELRARLDSRRLLIVCPKTLQDKWRLELRNRFGVIAQIVDASGLHELLEQNKRQKGEFAAIATIQALMPPKDWNKEDTVEKPSTPGHNRRALAHFLDSAAEEEALIDLFVVDEAHHMRNPGTTYFQLGELLNAVSEYRDRLEIYEIAEDLRLRITDLKEKIERKIDRAKIFQDLAIVRVQFNQVSSQLRN